MPSLLFTGIVPSPDSIFVRNCPRALLETKLRRNQNHQAIIHVKSNAGCAIEQIHIFKPIRMLIDANIIFVRTKYPGIAAWCCVYE